MQCPRCQHENPPGMKFCGECAASLASTCPRFLAEHLDILEAPLVIRENRVGHFSRRSGAAQPLRVELQGRSSLSETLQDERRPSRQILFHDPSILDIRDFIVSDIALDRDPLDGQAVEYARVPQTDPLRGRRPVEAFHGRQPSGSLVEIATDPFSGSLPSARPTAK